MTYHVKNHYLFFERDGIDFKLNLHESEEESLQSILQARNSDRSLIFSAVFALSFLLFVTVSLFTSDKLFSFVLTAIGAGLVLAGLEAWRALKNRKIEDFLYEVFNDREYQIEKEIALSALRLKEEEEQIIQIEAQIEHLKKVCADNQTNFITSQEKSSIAENLEHLAIRRDLRQAKVTFFKNYIKKWRIRKALHGSEDLLISEAKQEKGSSSRAVLQMQAQQRHQMEDMLNLRPLSERMELCDSREEAELLLEELRVLNV